MFEHDMLFIRIITHQNAEQCEECNMNGQLHCTDERGPKAKTIIEKCQRTRFMPFLR